MFKRIATVAVLPLFTSLPALSGSIDFEGSGDGGTWSWNGTSKLTADTLGMAVKIVGSFPNYAVSTPFETASSGPILGGTGTTSTPCMFGPSFSASFTITRCVPPATSCTPVTLFTGDLNSPGEMDVQGSNSMLFTASFATGSVDSALLSFLGLPSNTTKMFGTYDVTLLGTAPGSGLVASGDLVLSPCARARLPGSHRDSVFSGLLFCGTPQASFELDGTNRCVFSEAGALETPTVDLLNWRFRARYENQHAT
jgi:hypothetical protein